MPQITLRVPDVTALSAKKLLTESKHHGYAPSAFSDDIYESVSLALPLHPTNNTPGPTSNMQSLLSQALTNAFATI